MAGAADPRRAVDVEPEVAVSGERRLTGMEADAHAHRVVGMTSLDLDRCLDRGRGVRERGERLLAALVDDLAAVRGDGLPHDRPVLVQLARVRVAEALEQLGRALDVAEEERHRPGRQPDHGSTW